MAKYIVEFICTFFLVFTIGMCVLDPGAGNLAPVGIGMMLVALVFAGGHISGAHYNPAVTLALSVRGRCAWAHVPGYIISTLAAGLAGAALVLWFKGNPEAVPLVLDLKKALAAEFLFTFALAFVILNVATAKGTAGNSFYGLAIGMTVLGGAYAVGGVSGGSFNPAVSLALVVLGKLTIKQMIAYVAVQLFAGAVAGVLFKVLNPQDK